MRGLQQYLGKEKTGEKNFVLELYSSAYQVQRVIFEPDLLRQTVMVGATKPDDTTLAHAHSKVARSDFKLGGSFQVIQCVTQHIMTFSSVFRSRVRIR